MLTVDILSFRDHPANFRLETVVENLAAEEKNTRGVESCYWFQSG
jgi:hypothetical protein